MKKKIFVILLTALLITLFVAIPATAKKFPEIKASILRYEPSPAVQGEVMKVWVKIENMGTSATDVEIRFVPEYPFTLAPGEEGSRKIGVIPGIEEALEEFDIMVDLYAPNEEKEIKFQYKWTTAEVWAELKEPITIETYDSLVVVNNFETIPNIIKPGDEIAIKITIKNEGVNSIRTVDLTLDTTNNDVFSPVASGDTKRIEFLEPKESKEITFKLMTDSSAGIKIYNLPLKIRFVDDKNKDYETSSKIGIKMNAEPDLTMLVDSSEIFKSKTVGNVRVKIINKGIVDVKYITLKIIKTPDYNVLSPSNIIYIGNLDNDDFDSGEYLIKPLTKNPVLKFLIEYKDPYNKEYSKDYSLPLRIVSKSELGETKSKLPMVILLIVIVFAIYWFYKKRKNKNKK